MFELLFECSDCLAVKPLIVVDYVRENVCSSKQF